MRYGRITLDPARDRRLILLERETGRPILPHPFESKDTEMQPANQLIGNIRDNGPEMLIAHDADIPLQFLAAYEHEDWRV